jgi:hypothetical protein
MEALATAGVISYSQLIGGSRHVWSRDGGAELAFRRTLTEMGFVPVTSGFLITGKVLGESDAEPPEDLLRQQMLWGRFLESDTITRLRDEGFSRRSRAIRIMGLIGSASMCRMRSMASA